MRCEDAGQEKLAHGAISLLLDQYVSKLRSFGVEDVAVRLVEGDEAQTMVVS